MSDSTFSPRPNQAGFQPVVEFSGDFVSLCVNNHVVFEGWGAEARAEVNVILTSFYEVPGPKGGQGEDQPQDGPYYDDLEESDCLCRPGWPCSCKVTPLTFDQIPF